MYSEVMHDPKVQRLAPELFRFWVNCMCMAAENDGTLPSIHDIAWMLRKSERSVALQVSVLYEAGLLDREADTFAPHNWALRQYKSDTSTERVKKFRGKSETFQKRFRNGDETADETDQNRTEQIQNRAEPPVAPQGGALSPKTRTAKKRSTEEIKKALGPGRLPWWDAFWKVFPCHEGMNPTLGAYEQKVHSRELAVEIYHGAERYAAQIAQKRLIDPATPVKYGQGWLNDERWKDDLQPMLVSLIPQKPPRPDPIAMAKANMEALRKDGIR